MNVDIRFFVPCCHRTQSINIQFRAHAIRKFFFHFCPFLYSFFVIVDIVCSISFVSKQGKNGNGCEYLSLYWKRKYTCVCKQNENSSSTLDLRVSPLLPTDSIEWGWRTGSLHLSISRCYFCYIFFHTLNNVLLANKIAWNVNLNSAWFFLFFSVSFTSQVTNADLSKG